MEKLGKTEIREMMALMESPVLTVVKDLRENLVKMEPTD